MKNEIKNLIIIILLSLIIRFLLIDTATAAVDMVYWSTWAQKLMTGGFENFYTMPFGGLPTDYLPGYMYILWFLGKVKIIFSSLGISISNNLLFKTPSILADIGSTVIIYLLAKKYLNSKTAVTAAALYALNPAIFANSAMWGQVDGFQAFFLLLVLWLFIENYLYFGSAFFAYAVLIKPTSIFILPVILYIIFSKLPKNIWHQENLKFKNYIKIIVSKKEVKKFMLCFFIFFITIVLLALPFATDKLPWNFLIDQYKVAINQNAYASLNAFNFWALQEKMWYKDSIVWLAGFTFKQWGIIMFGSLFAIVFYFLHKHKNDDKYFLNIILASAIIFAGAFDLLTRIHERHLLAALPFMAILAVINRNFLFAYLFSSAVSFLNLYFSYARPWPVFDKDTVNFLSTINIAVLAFLFLEILIPEDKWTKEILQKTN